MPCGCGKTPQPPKRWMVRYPDGRQVTFLHEKQAKQAAADSGGSITGPL